MRVNFTPWRSQLWRCVWMLVAATAVTLGGATAGTSAESGLVAAYGFDEAAGTTVTDASGNSNTGTISGAARAASGHSGAALSFDGVDDMVTIADSASLDLTGAMTLEAWVKPAVTGSSWRAAILKERPGGLAYALYARTGAGGPAAHAWINGVEPRARAGSGIAADVWAHIAGTYDGSAIRLYVNGLELASAPASGPIAASSSPLRLGGTVVWNEWFAGTLDDVRIYSRALSATEIASDMLTPVGGPGSDTSPPATPTGLNVMRRTRSSIDFWWHASSDDRGVDRYGVYVDTAVAGSSTTTSATVGRLACGRTYALAVDAADAAGNRSGRTTIQASTSACSGGDSTPPTTPGAFAVTGSTQSSLSVSWTESTDNVGVAGYGVYDDGASVAALGSAARSHTYGGLACGRLHSLAVDTHDAAGNRSGKATVPGTTAACTSGGGGGPAVFVSNSGSDANACTQAAPCKTLDRAYRVVQPGGVIEFAGGTYPGQTLPIVTKSSATPVIVRPAAGSAVTVSSLSLWGKNAEFQDFKVIGSAYWHCDADNVDFVRGQMGLFFIRSADEIGLVGTEIGPWAADSDSDVGTAEDCREANKNLLLDGVWFHDHTSSNPPNGAHKQCVAVTAIDGLIIRNSRFQRCEDFDILFKRYGPVADLKNITLENNWFDKPYPDGSSAIQFSSPDGDDYTNLTIRNNSFAGNLTLKPDNRYLNTRIVGNAGYHFGGPCSGVTAANNVWRSGACGGDLAADPLFLNQPGGDLHLAADSPAIDRGDPSDHPALDIDGQARPMGPRSDAGADERR